MIKDNLGNPRYADKEYKYTWDYKPMCEETRKFLATVEADRAPLSGGLRYYPKSYPTSSPGWGTLFD